MNITTNDLLGDLEKFLSGEIDSLSDDQIQALLDRMLEIGFNRVYLDDETGRGLVNSVDSVRMLIHGYLLLNAEIMNLNGSYIRDNRYNAMCFVLGTGKANQLASLANYSEQMLHAVADFICIVMFGKGVRFSLKRSIQSRSKDLDTQALYQAIKWLLEYDDI